MVLSKKFFPEMMTLIFGLKPIAALPNSKLPISAVLPKVLVPADGWLFGRIALLRESAGKIRQIALVDPYTQWILKPIHD